jgi:hypothetical protein
MAWRPLRTRSMASSYHHRPILSTIYYYIPQQLLPKLSPQKPLNTPRFLFHLPYSPPSTLPTSPNNNFLSTNTVYTAVLVSREEPATPCKKQ